MLRIYAVDETIPEKKSLSTINNFNATDATFQALNNAR